LELKKEVRMLINIGPTVAITSLMKKAKIMMKMMDQQEEMILKGVK
tara:strand:+ start:721 stop:858 length:138 start_codon:yes stop_codon:yes gene_type:complete